MTYLEFTAKRDQALTEFPMVFAFSNEQFAVGLVKLNTTEKDITSIGAGGFIRKSDVKAYVNMTKQFAAQLEELMQNDSFLHSALRYELNNHEYDYTYEIEPTFDALGLSYDDERALKMVKQITNY